MIKKIFFASISMLIIAGGILLAADHIDAPSVTGSSGSSLGSDITDVYAFQSPGDNSKIVFAIGTQGLLSPSSTASATFPANTMYEINIDNTGDNVEDLVIQLLVQNNKLRVYGPVSPGSTGTNSTVKTNGPMTEVMVSAYGVAPIIGSGSNGVRVFAGPRDDPFFFDIARYKEIIAGTATGFRSPGLDSFAGTNIMALVIEVPKSLLGSASNINIWVESKTK